MSLPVMDSTSLRTAPPPGQHLPPCYGGRAGGTHPTGMFSCFNFILLVAMADNDTRIHIEIITFCQNENALKM